MFQVIIAATNDDLPVLLCKTVNTGDVVLDLLAGNVDAEIGTLDTLRAWLNVHVTTPFADAVSHGVSFTVTDMDHSEPVAVVVRRR